MSRPDTVEHPRSGLEPGAVTVGAASGRRRFGVRVRITAVATVAFGVAFAFASWLLVSSVRSELEARERSESASVLEDATDQLLAGRPPDQLRLTQFELTVQIYDANGDLLGGSQSLLGLDPSLWLLELDPLAGLVPSETSASDYVLLYESIGTPEGEMTVAVANPLSDLQESVDALGGVLWVATPLLTAALGAIVWFLVGRALRPVEAMRREVDEISHTTLDRRLAVPDTDDEVARLALTMNGMLDRLEAASAAQRQFVSDASHELRSPVAAIRTELEVATRGDEADWDAVAQRVLAEDDRIAALIDDLLTLARIDEAGLGAQTPVDLDELALAEAARSARVPIRTAGVGAARVVGDRAALARLLRNLVDNATRHAATEVRISLAVDAGVVALDVHDDGPGVPTAQRDRIFERFARLETARDRDRGGTGLGLAVVKSVAEAHGGSVQVDDSPLGGARFAVRLPAAY